MSEMSKDITCTMDVYKVATFVNSPGADQRADFTKGLEIIVTWRNCMFLRVRKRKSSRHMTSYGTKGRGCQRLLSCISHQQGRCSMELEAGELKMNW